MRKKGKDKRGDGKRIGEKTGGRRGEEKLKGRGEESRVRRVVREEGRKQGKKGCEGGGRKQGKKGCEGGGKRRKGQK